LFSFSYFSPWRFTNEVNELKILPGPITTLINSREVNQSLARSFILFAYKAGKLSGLIQVLINNPGNDAAAIEPEFAIDLVQIGRDWKEGVTTHRKNHDNEFLQASRIFSPNELRDSEFRNIFKTP
jgi:hypothetical protein